MIHAALLLAPRLVTPTAAPAGSDAELPRVLFLTQSAGFVHEVVARPADGSLAPAEAAFLELAAGRYAVECSQDASGLTRAKLDALDALVFFTSGELPMADPTALVDWVLDGGAFVGLHCAADTFYQFAPYQEMLGGVFDGHPWHQEVRLACASASGRGSEIGLAFAAAPSITDEIYQFRDFEPVPLTVLLALDLASVDASLGKRAAGDYALAWCRDWGQGSVFYLALGHRPAVWRDARFRETLAAGLDWALADDPRPAAPPSRTPGTAVLLGREVALPDLAQWRQRDGSDARWTLEGGALTVSGSGDLVSRQEFGDFRLHVEFACPAMPEAAGQARGNSGVYLHGRYELQVLDSFGLEPGLGDCGALYGKRVPDANACRAPGAWQSYDVLFQAPRFAADGAKLANARLSAWHNGYPIHRDVEIDAPTGSALGADERPEGPLLLQDHGNPVRYRNVWIEPLARR